ncbi:hypothetical protein EYC80_006587 [Monilinia laxa]|uniref:Uncharacterized protein n=1 Tax=Monilinia laxa TaxID=61186 RepID=A0A5N6JV24_MONLA|nr:hypothetical protein EYC80_006587 [Monilinia laxa]
MPNAIHTMHANTSFPSSHQKSFEVKRPQKRAIVKCRPLRESTTILYHTQTGKFMARSVRYTSKPTLCSACSFSRAA